jgi:hypothetical protein
MVKGVRILAKDTPLGAYVGAVLGLKKLAPASHRHAGISGECSQSDICALKTGPMGQSSGTAHHL